MCRSISEVLLFNDNNDKEKYLSILKKYLDRYKCKLYAYCLMDNHLHLHFDGCGFDVSTFMKSVNTSYVKYYNNTHKRRGPLFQDRFESRVLDTEEYNLAVSAYIHNNPKDIHGYAGREHLYKYSSYGIYLGIRKDTLELVDQGLMHQLFQKKSKEAFVKEYTEFVTHMNEIGSIEDILDKLSSALEYEYRSERKVIDRDHDPIKVITHIVDKFLSGKILDLYSDTSLEQIKHRSFCAYVLKVLCGLSYRKICSLLFNVSISGCSNLCSRGYQLMNKDENYSIVFDEIINLAYC